MTPFTPSPSVKPLQKGMDPILKSYITKESIPKILSLTIIARRELWPAISIRHLKPDNENWLSAQVSPGSNLVDCDEQNKMKKKTKRKRENTLEIVLAGSKSWSLSSSAKSTTAALASKLHSDAITPSSSIPGTAFMPLLRSPIGSATSHPPAQYPRRMYPDSEEFAIPTFRIFDRDTPERSSSPRSLYPVRV